MRHSHHLVGVGTAVAGGMESGHVLVGVHHNQGHRQEWYIGCLDRMGDSLVGHIEGEAVHNQVVVRSRAVAAIWVLDIA